MGHIRDRMDADLRLAGRSESTRRKYIGYARLFVKYFHRSPELLGEDEVRQFLLHLRQRKLSDGAFLQYLGALKFLFGVTLRRPEVIDGIPWPKVPRRKPAVLTRDEVVRIFAHAKTPFWRTFLVTTYAAGLRRMETANLRSDDIDATAGLIHILHGKGDKPRDVMLDPELLAQLRAHWRAHRLRGPWLFPARAREGWADHPVDLLAFGGDDDDRHAGGRANLFRQRQPVVARQHQIEQDQIDAAVGERLAHLLHRRHFDLADAFGGNPELRGQVVQGGRIVLAQPARLDDSPAARIKPHQRACQAPAASAFRLLVFQHQTVSAMAELRVLDPAMGSGAFLVAACQFLADRSEMALIDEGRWSPGDVKPSDRATLKRRIAERCLYGVDLNPTAVQLARLSMWLTTLAADRPLTFLDHHLATGNSLLGASIIDLSQPARPMRRLRIPSPLPVLTVTV